MDSQESQVLVALAYQDSVVLLDFLAYQDSVVFQDLAAFQDSLDQGFLALVALQELVDSRVRHQPM